MFSLLKIRMQNKEKLKKAKLIKVCHAIGLQQEREKEIDYLLKAEKME